MFFFPQLHPFKFLSVDSMVCNGYWHLYCSAQTQYIPLLRRLEADIGGTIATIRRHKT